jgi:tetratricopeptide (TPR) repeat protein
LTRGWAASETVDAFERIGVIAEKSGDLLRLAESAFVRAFHACLAADLSWAGALAEEAFQLALRDCNPTMMATVHTMQLIVCHYRGDLAGAEHYFVSGQRFFDDPVFRQYPTGIAISVFAWASWNAWILGRGDVARERLTKSRACVNHANPHDLAWLDVLAAILHAYMRENETVESSAARAVDICEQNHFPNEAAHARCFLGHARAELSRAAENVSLIRGGIDTLIEVGNRISIPKYMTYLAAAQYRAGAVADALETVEQALNFNPEEIVYRPETLRIRGELRLTQRNLEIAEADFLESIAMARKMGAKAWELRTTMSLARLLDLEGRQSNGRSMLAEIYGWFTEGFDTADLKEANSLLEELGNNGARTA